MGSIYNGQCTKCGALLAKDEGDYGHCLKCSNVGTTSELKAQAMFMSMGYAVARVLNPSSPTDLVVSNHNEWLPIQVKTAYLDGGRLIANVCKTTKTGRTSYTERECRAFVIVAGEDLYFIPMEVIRTQRITLSKFADYRVSGGRDLAWYEVTPPSTQKEITFPELEIAHVYYTSATSRDWNTTLGLRVRFVGGMRESVEIMTLANPVWEYFLPGATPRAQFQRIDAAVNLGSWKECSYEEAMQSITIRKTRAEVIIPKQEATS